MAKNPNFFKSVGAKELPIERSGTATTTFLNQLFDKPKAKLGERDLENCIVLTVVQEKDLISNYFGNDFISRQIPDERQIDLKSIIQRITLSKGIVLSEEAQLCSEYSQLKRVLENESNDYQVNVNTRLIMLNADSIPNFMEGQLHVLNSQYFINNTIERSPFFRCDGSTVKLGTSEYQIDKNKFAIYFQEEGQPNRSTNTFLTKMKEMGDIGFKKR